VKWLRGDRKEPIAIPKAKTFVERELHTLIVPEATESERGTYVCRAINAYGQVDTSATVDIISMSAIDGGKPATFVSRPCKKSIDVTIGEDVSISFRVSGTPKPRGIIIRYYFFLSWFFFTFFRFSFFSSNMDERTDGHYGRTEIVQGEHR